MANAGKWLMFAGALLVAAGAVLRLSGGKGWLGWLGHLPGDLRIETKGGGFYFPLTTCLLLALWRRIQG